MSKTNTPRRITRGSIAAIEIEKKSKFLNSPIKLDLNDELVRSGSSKRKEGSTMKVAERKIDKRRKVKDVVSGMIGKHVVNEEQEERSEEELEATEEAQHVKKLIKDYFASFIKVGDKTTEEAQHLKKLI
ncbi:hypothetical protein AABB24_013782 [Solanum stoloniferum]|uniref:Uncharacterized protein n=1 Tax=Solanum stoloniferum TaxID=62892 RepID=A0ABD2TVN8_9SOLN